MSFPGMASQGASSSSSSGGLSEREQAIVKVMQSGMESCVTKSAMAGGMGFVLGGFFGAFMASGQAMAKLSTREQIRRSFKDMGTRSYSSARGFALVGAVYSGTECCIEGLRAKSDLANSVAAGCVTGGILARNSGPQAALLGCGGFAAFSAAIDAYMRMPDDS